MSKKIRNIVGIRFGRLVVISDSSLRAGDGSVKWNCICDCGNTHLSVASNLRSGAVRSCGCLAIELSSKRGKEKKQDSKKCKLDGCENDTSKGSDGYCGKHSQRIRRYGDPSYVTSEDVRRSNNRKSQLSNVISVKETTYRKFHGKHEHRVVAEQMIGRHLLPGEHVHHIDGNKQNNSKDNLQVMTASEHLKLHAKGRKNG